MSQVCCDMAPASISGVEAHLPQAAVTFDRDPVIALLNRAVDEVQRQEAREVEGLQATRYLWLKNPENLTPPPAGRAPHGQAAGPQDGSGLPHQARPPALLGLPASEAGWALPAALVLLGDP